jgi:hypothetical protein
MVSVHSPFRRRLDSLRSFLLTGLVESRKMPDIFCLFSLSAFAESGMSLRVVRATQVPSYQSAGRFV